MSQHLDDLIEQYVNSLKPSKADKIGGALFGVGSLIDSALGRGSRNAASDFDRFVTGQTQRREGRARDIFSNQLKVATAGRERERLDNEQTRLGHERERIDLQRLRDENAQTGDFSVNPDFISPLDQSRIDENNARAALLGGQLGRLGQGGGGELPAGVRSGMVRSFLDKSFETVDQEGNVTGIRKVPKFSLAKTPEEMAAIADSARSLGMFGDFSGVQQPSQGLGQESVFPQPTFGLPPMIAPNDNEWGEANIDDWGILDDKTKVRIIELARSQGALQ